MMDDYNYTKFAAADYELVRFDGPEMGSKAPDVKLSDLEGSDRALLEFSGDFLVLEFGSITCPLFQSRRGGMARIMDEFAQVVSVVIYVREAHPGRDVPAHGSMADKTVRARQLRDVDGEGRLILVDDMDGAAHRAFGSYPNAVFIVNRNGCVVYRSAWNNPRATRAALRRLLAGKSVRAEGMFVPPKPPVAFRTFRAAGKGSARDFFGGLPRLAWNNLLKRNFRLVFGRGRGVRGDVEC